ncbi:MAG: histidine kinase dimerization/phospho-acceptor domain-containing protein, partial [Myxococcales bacterium]
MPPLGKRGTYLGFVAHEIKNPLATALWSCDLLKRMEGADRTGERAEKMIDVSLRALRRMRRLIDDFFTIERLLEQGYELKREKVALKDLVEPAMRVLADKDGIATEGWVVELDDAATSGDAEMLRRAVR